MKTYLIDVRYIINAKNEEELQKELLNMEISSNEYYGGYDIVDMYEEYEEEDYE